MYFFKPILSVQPGFHHIPQEDCLTKSPWKKIQRNPRVSSGCQRTKVACQDLNCSLQGGLVARVQMVSSLITLQGTEL